MSDQPTSHFFAYLSRMRLIRRWGLMRGREPENIQEHSHRVAVLAHALATLANVRHGAALRPERAAFLALLHDAGETITGDLPTPIKYFNPGIREAYGAIEESARRSLAAMLPADLAPAYAPAFEERPEDAAEWGVVRAADKLCAWLKCVEERRAGNPEFLHAERSLKAALDALARPEVEDFLREFAPSYGLTLDELG